MITTSEQREYILKSVKRFWFGYKVCDSCDTLLVDDIAICPKCNAYRFDDTKERIVQIATELLDTNISE